MVQYGLTGNTSTCMHTHMHLHHRTCLPPCSAHAKTCPGETTEEKSMMQPHTTTPYTPHTPHHTHHTTPHHTTHTTPHHTHHTTPQDTTKVILTNETNIELCTLHHLQYGSKGESLVHFTPHQPMQGWRNKEVAYLGSCVEGGDDKLFHVILLQNTSD